MLPFVADGAIFTPISLSGASMYTDIVVGGAVASTPLTERGISRDLPIMSVIITIFFCAGTAVGVIEIPFRAKRPIPVRSRAPTTIMIINDLFSIGNLLKSDTSRYPLLRVQEGIHLVVCQIVVIEL